MELKKRYEWSSLPNNLYAIYDVEILRPFNDPKRGHCDIAKMQELVGGLNKQIGAGQYVPAFFGHHEGYENHVGAGFLDNYRIAGDLLYCDMVNIPEEAFQEIKAGHYPYRSIEYQADSNRITGLALCGSQISYFVFPMFFLEENERKDLKFGLKECSDRIIKFCGCGGQIKMEDYTPQDPNAPKKDEEINKGDETQKMKCSLDQEGGKLDQILQSIQSLAAGIQKLLSLEESEAEGKEEDKGTEGSEEAPIGDKKESSVAYQLQQFEKRMDARFQQLENRQNFSAYEKDLQGVCEDQGLDYNYYSERLQKFSTDTDRKVFVDSLRDFNRFGPHRMNRLLQNMNLNLSSVTGSDGKVLQKYQALDPESKMIAQRALKMYQETLLNPDQRAVSRFTACWTPEKWIDNALEASKTNPNYLESMKL